MIPPQKSNSILFITLDSCRHDTFVSASAPNLKAVGPTHRAMAPGNFTYGSHAAMFVGFTPGVADRAEPFINPKYGKIFRLAGTAVPAKRAARWVLNGKTIIDGFKRLGYLTVGSGSVNWFNPATEAGWNLTHDFDRFFYPGNYWSLGKQLDWLSGELASATRPVFAFLNIGETHVPYYFQGADWSELDNPCVPFSPDNRAEECRRRQRLCLEFTDRMLGPLLGAFGNSTVLVCGDHGDCWGEDGLWEHGFSHPKVLEVPLLFRLGPV